ncbi:conserved domain protein [Streptococcus mitis SK1080]|uniref:Conserved domain protein n=1 Tax=Streptococcus mitis SK1080 TaxID=1008453 RepID=F9HL12_STRMT|nr:conserved domain protein [Streptococcus mitis SK1080]
MSFFQIHVFFVVGFCILHKSSIALPKQKPTSPAVQRFLKCMEEEISGLLKRIP